MTVDKIFEALSSAPRRRILAYLSKTDMTAGEIVQRFAAMMSQPAISKHLSVLENAGLVWREKRGPKRSLRTETGRACRHACALPRRGVPALAPVPQGQRRRRQAQGEPEIRLRSASAGPASRVRISRREFRGRRTHGRRARVRRKRDPGSAFASNTRRCRFRDDLQRALTSGAADTGFLSSQTRSAVAAVGELTVASQTAATALRVWLERKPVSAAPLVNAR